MARLYPSVLTPRRNFRTRLRMIQHMLVLFASFRGLFRVRVLCLSGSVGCASRVFAFFWWWLLLRPLFCFLFFFKIPNSSFILSSTEFYICCTRRDRMSPPGYLLLFGVLLLSTLSRFRPDFFSRIPAHKRNASMFRVNFVSFLGKKPLENSSGDVNLARCGNGMPKAGTVGPIIRFCLWGRSPHAERRPPSRTQRLSD